jgi:hypothetical protein
MIREIADGVSREAREVIIGVSFPKVLNVLR